MADFMNEPESEIGLLQAWAAWRPGSPPHVLEADRPALASSTEVTTIRSWSEAFQAENFPFRGDTKLHLGLTAAVLWRSPVRLRLRPVTQPRPWPDRLLW